MKFPDRPAVTAGLGVAFALIILMALSTPAFFQTASPMNAANVVSTNSATSMATTLAITATHPYPAPNGTSSFLSSSTHVENSVAASGSSSSSSSPYAVSSSSTVTAAIKSTAVPSSSTAAGAVTSMTVAATTVTEAATTTATSATVPSAGPNYLFGTSESSSASSLSAASSSALYIFANKLTTIGVIALVVAFAAALVMYRKINSSD